MKPWRNVLLGCVLAPVIVVGAFVGYLALTYISETVTTGSAYGFEIGSSKQQSLADAEALLGRHPAAVIRVVHGRRAGDYFTAVPSREELEQLEPHDNLRSFLSIRRCIEAQVHGARPARVPWPGR